MAKRLGLNAKIKGYPSVALGAFEVTPIEMAGAYTVFANEGVYVRPTLVSSVRGSEGRVIYAEHPETRRALDGRVNYLMVNMLQEVLRRTHLSAAPDLATVVAEEGHRIGADGLVLYLLDHEQRCLVPVPGPGTSRRG